jgi:LemA protein
MSPFMLLTLAIVVVIVFVITIYNKLVKMRNHADEAWSDIDVQLKRRYNLIPNIVETVKGYAAHEDAVFTKVTEARSNAINAGSLKEQAQAENMLSGALKSLFAVAENYPELKANENFMQLQNELVDTEDKIQAARRFYNGTVRDYNTKLQQFPNNLIAGMFKFEDKEFFEVEDEEQKEPVEVSFDKDKDEKKEEAAPAAEETAPAEEAPKEEEKPEEEKPAEPAPETPAEEEKKEEKPAEEAPKEEEKPAEPEASAEPAKCPKCGGEMTEGHVCPMPEKKEEEAPVLPIEPAAEEKKEEEEKPEGTA